MPPHVLLITGCASGFGLRIARTAAEAGHIVYAGVRNLSRAEALVAASHALPIHVLALDITNPAQRTRAIETIQGTNTSGLVLPCNIQPIYARPNQSQAFVL